MRPALKCVPQGGWSCAPNGAVCLGARWLQVALIVHHARSRDPLPPGPQTPLTAVDSSKLKSGPDMSRHDPGGATAIIATVGQLVRRRLRDLPRAGGGVIAGEQITSGKERAVGSDTCGRGAVLRGCLSNHESDARSLARIVARLFALARSVPCRWLGDRSRRSARRKRGVAE